MALCMYSDLVWNLLEGKYQHKMQGRLAVLKLAAFGGPGSAISLSGSLKRSQDFIIPGTAKVTTKNKTKICCRERILVERLRWESLVLSQNSWMMYKMHSLSMRSGQNSGDIKLMKGMTSLRCMGASGGLECSNGCHGCKCG